MSFGENIVHRQNERFYFIHITLIISFSTLFSNAFLKNR